MSLLSSDDLPPADRFEFWLQQTALDLAPAWVTSDRVDDFRASAKLLEWGHARFSELEFSSLRAVRDRRMIQRGDPEQWQLAFAHRGTMRLEQGGRQVRMTPGNLVLYDTSRPFNAEVSAETGQANLLVLHLPRNSTPLPESALRDLVARPLPVQTGFGALLRPFLEGVIEQAAAVGTGDTTRLGSAATDLATAFLASLVGAERELPPHGRRRALLHEIRTFIARNLAEPDLSPRLIAEAHHISVRHLHNLFQQDDGDDRSVGQFIRDQRLERCRSDLSEPRNDGVGVAQIGARWGYRDAATFSRAFKAAYGLSPGAYRAQHSPPPPLPP